jgi:hypothetical protein
MKTYGGVDIETLVLLTSAQVRGKASRLGRFTPGTRWIGLVFNLGYEYPRGYTKTFRGYGETLYGIRKIEKKKKIS